MISSGHVILKLSDWLYELLQLSNAFLIKLVFQTFLCDVKFRFHLCIRSQFSFLRWVPIDDLNSEVSCVFRRMWEEVIKRIRNVFISVSGAAFLLEALRGKICLRFQLPEASCLFCNFCRFRYGSKHIICISILESHSVDSSVYHSAGAILFSVSPSISVWLAAFSFIKVAQVTGLYHSLCYGREVSEGERSLRRWGFN